MRRYVDNVSICSYKKWKSEIIIMAINFGRRIKLVLHEVSRLDKTKRFVSSRYFSNEIVSCEQERFFMAILSAS